MILVPTLNRIDGLTRFIKSFVESEDPTPGLVIVDGRDFDSKKSTYTELKADFFPDNWDYRVTEGVTMGEKAREVWPEIEKLDWVGILNDDHVIITPQACKRLVEQLTGKNFISCNDRWNSPARIAGLTAWSMPLLKVCGFPMFIPGMHHLYIDDLWKAIADHTGTWDLDHSVVIEHRHVLKKQSPLDATHQKTYAQTSFQHDHDVFQAYMKNDFPALVERINKFTLDVTQERAAHG